LKLEEEEEEEEEETKKEKENRKKLNTFLSLRAPLLDKEKNSHGIFNTLLEILSTPLLGPARVTVRKSVLCFPNSYK
jgi:hypothetical protein